ncbi:MAG: hypothetical protein ACLQJR_34950 [Stellaceae bacterium]
MRLSRSLAPLLLPLALAQCGILAPYQTVPATLTKSQRAPVPAGGTAPTLIGVCYNTFTATAEQVRAIAEQACEPGTVPHAFERDFKLINCPLLQPARVTFACMAKAP